MANFRRHLRIYAFETIGEGIFSHPKFTIGNLRLAVSLQPLLSPSTSIADYVQPKSAYVPPLQQQILEMQGGVRMSSQCKRAHPQVELSLRSLPRTAARYEDDNQFDAKFNEFLASINVAPTEIDVEMPVQTTLPTAAAPIPFKSQKEHLIMRLPSSPTDDSDQKNLRNTFSTISMITKALCPPQSARPYAADFPKTRKRQRDGDGSSPTHLPVIVMNDAKSSNGPELEPAEANPSPAASPHSGEVSLSHAAMEEVVQPQPLPSDTTTAPSNAAEENAVAEQPLPNRGTDRVARPQRSAMRAHDSHDSSDREAGEGSSERHTRRSGGGAGGGSRVGAQFQADIPPLQAPPTASEAAAAAAAARQNLFWRPQNFPPSQVELLLKKLFTDATRLTLANDVKMGSVLIVRRDATGYSPVTVSAVGEISGGARSARIYDGSKVVTVTLVTPATILRFMPYSRCRRRNWC